MFKNAYEGVSRIYKAVILSLIATVLILVGGIMGISGTAAGAAAASESSLVIAGIVAIIAVILMIIAEVINIIGVNRASKDEPAFKNALIALLVGIVSNILISCFSSNSAVSSIGKSITNITEILASYYICTGIINLADRLNDAGMSARGRKIRSLLMGIWIAAAVMNLVTILSGTNQTMLFIIGLIAVIGGICSIVAYFLYFGLLGRAKQMLAAK